MNWFAALIVVFIAANAAYFLFGPLLEETRDKRRAARLRKNINARRQGHNTSNQSLPRT
ncbi:hypothetical protein LB543_04905 [Mesorhizobium sp. ESP7-2]|uniref:hypothetical protein n=1 Tax=Mesorhizobium sp. ESP7-2 TaxID=2876622 RepID=UPI001CCB3654|nr:hypothetical protein [Mesorhizobium sp. ESP7-2]MBZ9706058.1 hypothetical protein [Mesorhizobium sp. ESP7-2]